MIEAVVLVALFFVGCVLLVRRLFLYEDDNSPTYLCGCSHNLCVHDEKGACHHVGYNHTRCGCQRYIGELPLDDQLKELTQ